MSSIIPYGRQDVSEADIEAVVAILKGDFLTQGPAVDAFEAKLAAYMGAKHVVAVSNGTAGLHLAYLAAGIGPGDAVIVPAITFAATANAALYCGATPIFADIDPDTACISLESILRCIDIAKSSGLRPRAIAPVHFAGLPCEMEKIAEIAATFNMTVIEDACHALGAEYRGKDSRDFKKIGSCDYSSMAVFSFHPVKHITTGEGGAIAVEDSTLAARLKMLRSHGITKNSHDFLNKTLASHNGSINPWYHEMQLLGFNYRICDIQAALGASQLNRIEGVIAARRKIASYYDEAFGSLSSLVAAPRGYASSKHSYHLYPLQIDFRGLGLSRSEYMSRLRDCGVGTQVHYLPVHWHPYYQSHSAMWKADQTPAAEAFYQTELSIPMFSSMLERDVEKVVDAVRLLCS